MDHADPSVTRTVHLIRQLGSQNANDRERANQELALSGLTPEPFLRAFETVQFESGQWRIRSAHGKFALMVLAVMMLCGMVYNERGWYTVVFISVSIWIARAQFTRGKRAAFERGMAVVISYYKDVRFIGPTLDMYRNEAETEIRLAPILIDLLSRLQEHDCSHINERQRQTLYRELERCCLYYQFAPEMAVAGVKALARVGDRSAVPMLEKLLRSAKDRPVQEAARQSLPVLVERINASSMKASLLRPAQRETASEDLLRAATGVSGKTGELLRPADEDTVTILTAISRHKKIKP